MWKSNITILRPKDTLFPAPLRTIPRPPEKIYVMGNLIDSDFEGIAVVGSRRMTSYGEAVVRSIVGDLVSLGFTIISGLAYGVDIAAQKLAFEMGGRTVAVLASGFNKISPSYHAQFAREVVEKNRGALVSVFEPDEDAFKSNFPRRDFLIAALAKAVLVVEAAYKSGTHYTVDAALELGKEVFAVPGSIFSDFSAGCHNYIKQGAHLVSSTQDILDILGADSTSSKATFSHISSKKNKLARTIIYSSGLEKRVHEAILVDGILIEELCKKLSEPIAKVLPVLTSLEFKSLIKVVNGAVFRLNP